MQGKSHVFTEVFSEHAYTAQQGGSFEELEAAWICCIGHLCKLLVQQPHNCRYASSLKQSIISVSAYLNLFQSCTEGSVVSQRPSAVSKPPSLPMAGNCCPSNGAPVPLTASSLPFDAAVVDEQKASRHGCNSCCI